jgi:hypothetical protein
MVRFKTCVQILRTKITLQTELDLGKVLQTITFKENKITNWSNIIRGLTNKSQFR